VGCEFVLPFDLGPGSSAARNSASRRSEAKLRWILEQKQVANQEVVLIEHTTAWLVESSPLAET
jgi:hypothetical protein